MSTPLNVRPSMRRNYLALTAWILLFLEFAIPFAVGRVFPEWVRQLGPGGPYLAAFWLAALSLIGVVTAVGALALSFHGFNGRIASSVVLAFHLIVGTPPFVAVIRLIFGLY